MTRSDLVEELAARFGQLTHRDAEFAVKTLLDAMSDALVRGHRIELRGFGSFSINRRPPRMGRNPRSGESVAIPEKRVPHFKPGKALREAVAPSLDACGAALGFFSVGFAFAFGGQNETTATTFIGTTNFFMVGTCTELTGGCRRWFGLKFPIPNAFRFPVSSLRTSLLLVAY